MVRKSKKSSFDLPLNTIIEVVAIKGEKFQVIEMEYGKALAIKKKRGWIYRFYQKGFSQFKDKTK